MRSSTSDDVCELWNGVGIVRVAGSPDILQLIYDRDNAGRTDDREPHRENDGSVGVYALHEAMKDSTENRVPDSEYHSEANEHNISLNTLNTNNDLETGSSNIAFSRSNAETDLQTGAPNISLNTSNSAVSKTELWVIALIGIFLQSGVLVLDAAATYYSGLQWKKGGRIVVGYAFPFTFIGTLGVVVGMFVCAYVIEASTKECTWKAKSDQTNMQILWIQRSQTVSDQRFKSYAIYAAKDRKFIMTSRPAPAKQFQFWTNVGTVISIGGKQDSAVFHLSLPNC
jgi:hypothetical protein